MSADEAKARELRARLDAIAPWQADGNVSAAALARCMAVRAQERWTKQLSGSVPIDSQQVAAMLAEWGLSHALLAFSKVDPWMADETATKIRDAFEDGGAVGEFLWEHLGRETAQQVASLTGELIAATRPEPVHFYAQGAGRPACTARSWKSSTYSPRQATCPDCRVTEAWRLAEAAGIEVAR